MKAPAFWTYGTRSWASKLLTPLAHLYNAQTSKRAHQKARFKSDLPVICIGNLTMGGAGKTPSAIAICEYLKTQGKKPAFLSRGYGGRLTGPVMVNNQDASDVGDEPLLLKQHAPVCIAHDRILGAQLCQDQGADVIIMDDGYQNPSLHKDISFVVVDGGYGHGNEKTFPAGPLRESLESGLSRADAIILIGEDQTGCIKRIQAIRPDLPILNAHINADPRPDLVGRTCFAFAGIARPDKFYTTLRDMGVDLVGTQDFSDHHAFSQDEISNLQKQADALNAQLITTEKDHVRLTNMTSAPIDWIKISLDFDRPDMLHAVLHQLFD